MIIQFVKKSLVLAEMDARKIMHEPSELIARAIQPVIWLLLFGQVLSHDNLIKVDNISYIDYITPGILAQSILFVAIFNGLSVIWEKDLGLVQKLLVTPTPRAALVFGKALAAGVRAFSQVLVVYILAIFLGVHLIYSFTSFFGILFFTMLGAAIFSTFSLIIACIVKTRERFMGIGQVLTMPLFFASNAIYPISDMPNWIKSVVRFNPLTYEVDALRELMIKNVTSAYGVSVDLIILIVTLIILTYICAKLYPRLVI